MWLNKDKLIKLVFIYWYIRLQYIILFCVWLSEHLNKSIGEKINSHIPNAVPTAEGAIEIAIAETPFTIHGSKSLVLGYGKIGKILSKDLYALGAQTYVEARKYADLAMIEGHGYEPLPLDNFTDFGRWNFSKSKKRRSYYRPCLQTRGDWFWCRKIIRLKSNLGIVVTG